MVDTVYQWERGMGWAVHDVHGVGASLDRAE